MDGWVILEENGVGTGESCHKCHLLLMVLKEFD